MRCRLVATAAIGVALVVPGVAGAASGPVRLQALAAAQTVYLFANLTGTQPASPRVCGENQPSSGFLGIFLLPTLSFSPGDATFDCRITTHTVVLDLNGGIVSEDANQNAPWVFADGSTALFTRNNLERICDDVRTRFVQSPSPATLDGKPIGGTAVTTRPFPVPIRRTAPGTYWADSVAVGHPGILAATFCGWKAELSLSRGKHVITVDHSALFEPPQTTRFTYNITVR
jgi:hypothetical protein